MEKGDAEIERETVREGRKGCGKGEYALTDQQILGCELHQNAFGGCAPPGPAGGAIASPRLPSRYYRRGARRMKGKGGNEWGTGKKRRERKWRRGRGEEERRKGEEGKGRICMALAGMDAPGCYNRL